MREGGAEPHRGAAMNELRIWLNGELVPQAEAVLPVDSAAVFYGTNVFEGLRAYWNEADEELYAFRLQEHFTRLRESMKMMRFTVPYSDVDLYEAVREVLRGNAIREDVHMHLVAYVVGVGMDATSPTGVYINPRRRGRISAAGLRSCRRGPTAMTRRSCSTSRDTSPRAPARQSSWSARAGSSRRRSPPTSSSPSRARPSSKRFARLLAG